MEFEIGLRVGIFSCPRSTVRGQSAESSSVDESSSFVTNLAKLAENYPFRSFTRPNSPGIASVWTPPRSLVNARVAREPRTTRAFPWETLKVTFDEK